jgi:hypothetical protein
MDILALYEFTYWSHDIFTDAKESLLALKAKHPDWFEQEPVLMTILHNLRAGKNQSLDTLTIIKEQARRMLEDEV